MADAGDIHIADLRDETRRVVLVISDARFERLSSRAIVVPEFAHRPDDERDPWRIEIEGRTFAVDLIGSIPSANLLDRVGRATYAEMAHVQRALRTIT